MPAVSPETEHRELSRSPEGELSVRLLPPPAAASTAALLPHALRVLRDAPAETAAFRRPSQVTLALSASSSLFFSCIDSLIVCLSFLAVLLSSSSSVSPVRWLSVR